MAGAQRATFVPEAKKYKDAHLTTNQPGELTIKGQLEGLGVQEMNDDRGGGGNGRVASEEKFNPQNKFQGGFVCLKKKKSFLNSDLTLHYLGIGKR